MDVSAAVALNIRRYAHDRKRDEREGTGDSEGLLAVAKISLHPSRSSIVIHSRSRSNNVLPHVVDTLLHHCSQCGGVRVDTFGV